MPEIRLTGNDLWLEFPFSAGYMATLGQIDSSKEFDKDLSKTSVKTSVKILRLLNENPEMTLAEAATMLDRLVRAVEMAASKLVKSGKLEYVGPRRGGYWKVKE